jgi:putative nucleotidyltransferase with HDIG domain
METPDRILFIDDDKNVRTAFARSLRGQGYEVDLADTPEAAHTFVGQHEYAVIASDYRMPDANGIDVIDDLQRLQPNATFMLVSGECDRDLVLEAINGHDITNVIAKPWDTGEIRDIVRRGIGTYVERSKQLGVQQGAVLASRSLEEMRSRMATVVAQAERHVVDMLVSMIARRDPLTHAHCRRVAAYARVLAKAMGASERMCAAIEAGALLHDIGKIVVPDSILRKPGTLDPQERTLMQQHPTVAAELLAPFESLRDARDIVMQHHERWDGGGYPQGLSGAASTLGARIVAVADALDAMLTGGAHQRPLSIEFAWNTIVAGGGTQFDPQVVAAFRATRKQLWVELRSESADALQVA